MIPDESIECTIRESKRAKRLRLAVYCDGSVVVTTPVGVQQTIIRDFIIEKRNWIYQKLDLFRSIKTREMPVFSVGDYAKCKEQARILATERVEYFKEFFIFNYNKINIKNHKKRWGSCSKKRNLNFNYKIIFLPEDIRDYIIVHEICHLLEFSHSKKFWGLVRKALPNYMDVKKKLQEFDLYTK